MTVGELIIKLQSLPKDKKIFIESENEYSDYPYNELSTLTEETLLINGDDVQLFRDGPIAEYESKEDCVVISNR